MSRALRLALTFATALCAWLWVGVAEASTLEAPRCDDRGATTFAEAPTMQPLYRSLQVMAEDDGCVQPDTADVCDAEGHGKAPAPDRVHADLFLPVAPHLVVDEAGQSGVLGSAPLALDAAPAHAGLLERPPR